MGRKIEKDTFRLGFPDFYKSYKKRKADLKQQDVVDIKVYRKVVQKFLDLMIDKIINEAFVFHMPYGCGAIRLNEREAKPTGGIANYLRLKAWDKAFTYAWDKTLVFFHLSELRSYKPSEYMLMQKKKRILLQNDNPYLKDMIAHMQNRHDKRLQYLRDNYKKNKSDALQQGSTENSD